jgi:cytochrome c-type biogenesis protein CcmH
MLLWIVFAGLTALLLGIVLRPLAQGALTASADDRIFDKAVYRDQLSELARETEEGMIPPSEAEAARTEIARRLLKADAKGDERSSSSASLRNSALMASIIAVPLFTLTFYVLRGSPELPAVPLAARLANAESNRDLEALIAKVEAHLAQNPLDPEGWRAIAPAYRALGRYEDSARAYARALEIGKACTGHRHAPGI